MTSPTLEETTTELSVGGMSCASCVAHVTEALTGIPGVDDAVVNLATERATVRHAAPLDPALLVAAVEHAGYTAAPVTDAAPDPDAARRDRDVRRRGALLAFGVLLFVPLLVLGMAVGPFPGKDVAMLALAVPIWAVVGLGFHRGALAALRRGTATMDTLVSLGSTAALAYSIDATLTGRPAFYETAGAIVTLVSAGKYLETAAKGRTNRAMRALLALRPQTARRLDADGALREIAVDDARIGDLLVVAPGDRIPVDGVVVEGEGTLDVSALTGEPIPAAVGPGDVVRTGAIAGEARLVVRATAVGAGTTLARIVATVRRAQASTPPVQRLADRIAAVFVPVILAVALVTFGAWLATGHPWPAALTAAVAVLVVACPCALGLATPTAVVAGVGAAAAQGVLVRDAQVLEALADVDVVLFDKTGTLTTGRPELVGIFPATGVEPGELLAAAAAVERGSAHPFAAAVERAAEAAHLVVPPSAAAEAVPGRGVRAIVGGARTLAGSPAFLRAEGIAVPDAAVPAGASVLAVARDGRALGVLALADTARPGAADAVAALRRMGIGVRVVSGDAAGPTTALAAAVGADGADPETLPDDKAALVAALQARGRRVAFVGDGINDAPALAVADAGVAMGAGTDVALETAGAALASNDPRAVATAIALGRATRRIVRQNLFWAFAYNVVLVPLAAVGIVAPILAAAAMGASSLVVVANALRLARRAG